MTVIFKLVCRVLDEGVFSGSGSRFSFSHDWRLALTRYQVSTWVLTILADKFRTCNASTGQRAYTPHVFCFKLIDNGSWEFTCHRQKSKLWSIRGIRRQNMIDMHYFTTRIFVLSLSIHPQSRLLTMYIYLSQIEKSDQRHICSTRPFHRDLPSRRP